LGRSVGCSLGRSRRRTPIVALLAMAGAATLAACGSTGPGKTNPGESADDSTQVAVPDTPARVELDLFLLGRVRGTIAPCGCTTEPLGGLQYALGYVEASSQPGARLVLEPGSFLYPEPGSPEWPLDDQGWAQAQERAKALQGRFAALGDALVSGVGPIDVRSPTGAAALASYPLPRVLANLSAPSEGTGSPHMPPHRLVPLGRDGVTLVAGVTAVVDPSLPEAARLGTLGDPVAALREQVAAMRKAGAGFTVAMAHGNRAFAEQLAREVDDLDLVVVGVVEGTERQRLGQPTAQLSGTFIVEPGEQLQSLTHLTLTFAPGLPAVPRVSDWLVQPPRATQEAELARLHERLEKFSADPEADPAFLARLQAEHDALRAALAAPPEGDAVAVFDQVKITCKLAVDAEAGQRLSAYTAWVAEQNEAFFKGKRAPEPPAGAPAYAGIAECETCHEEAVAFWRTTVHAGAYQTLVDTNQQHDLACIGCHITGFREPGGSEVVENASLRDVQCEVCHGPGSFHVDEPEAKKGGAQHIRLDSPEEVCGKCHTPEHSDTFDYVAYMRDVLGTGHGPEARKALGDGSTGAELRAAGLARAGGKCKKM
jgi:predicted small lipoprotein YifL